MSLRSFPRVCCRLPRHPWSQAYCTGEWQVASASAGLGGSISICNVFELELGSSPACQGNAILEHGVDDKVDEARLGTVVMRSLAAQKQVTRHLLQAKNKIEAFA